MVALTNINLGGVEPSIGVSVTILPEGWHTGMVRETKSVASKTPGSERNSMLEVHFAFQGGETFVNRYNLWNDNADTCRIAQQELAALCIACGIDPGTLRDTGQLHNSYVPIYLSVETADYNNKKITVNRLKALKTKDGKVLGTVPPASAAGAGGGAPAAGFTPPAAPAAGAAPAAAPQAGFTPPAAPNGGAPYPAAGGQPAPTQQWGQGQGQPAPAQGGFQPQPGPGPGPGPGPQQGGFPAQGAAPQPGFGAPAAGFGAPAGGGWGGPTQ